MSDPGHQPTETVADTGDINGLKPLSNADDYDISLPTTGADLSRLSNRGAISIANGLPIDEEEDDDEGDEEVGGDYVAVDHDDINDFSYWFRRPPMHQRTKLDELHPFVQVLNVSNVDDCVTVENAFPEHERCSRDKVGLPPHVLLGASMANAKPIAGKCRLTGWGPLPWKRSGIYADFFRSSSYIVLIGALNSAWGYLPSLF